MSLNIFDREMCLSLVQFQEITTLYFQSYKTYETHYKESKKIIAQFSKNMSLFLSADVCDMTRSFYDTPPISR